MSAYSATLSDDVMTTARKAFERYDHDDSGTIQIEEVVQALQDAKRDATEAQVFQLLDSLGLSDGSSGLRFHEFLELLEKLPEQHRDHVIDEDNDAFAASFQWLGGNPEDPDSSITKETIQKVLQDFELDSNVDAV
ncbi:hypothetical protein GUITHDRAFT_113447 [Guillardia theta CCMP2712]|uniref:EF-hand domain-containing protein n=1 Tax=Guillardia theta (strain CCMP2712) TaxID=905079 RepID=L1IVY5_GUITC|nr:hypothetical protein GUITHDRAFT_113447 [Guillardia theta CCMP2712]EKX40418.1 hypothetical protein GUITHDRAFT_113447 [Guillardia theta CCMP2712]|eukprot:XP_005827398.1 hypothetical protein GUITHDRAFT_113447 [Guillardia theta CCMP2712]